MKFFCHIKIVDQNFARLTFAVMHDSYSTFVVTPIQSFVAGDSRYIPPITLYKTGSEWSYQDETDSRRMSDRILAEVLSELKKRLDTSSSDRSTATAWR